MAALPWNSSRPRDWPAAHILVPLGVAVKVWSSSYGEIPRESELRFSAVTREKSFFLALCVSRQASDVKKKSHLLDTVN